MSAVTLRPPRLILKFVLGQTHALKNSPVIFKACRCESTLPRIKSERINDNIVLKTISDAPRTNRPLVLLYGWMLAKPRHLDKYANLYHSKGFDVMTLQMKLTQVLLPWRAQRTVEELLSALGDSSLKDKDLMVHGFSVGGYMYGETLVKMAEQQEQWSNVRDRFVGQIFDSPVDFDGISVGFSRILVKNQLGQKALQALLDGYLRVFDRPITSQYRRASDNFKRNDLRLPTLMLYSRTDPIGCHVRIEEVTQKWITRGIPVMRKCWESSPHVSHFHRHPDEYVEMVLAFLDSIKLSPRSEDKKEQKERQEGSAEKKRQQEIHQAF